MLFRSALRALVESLAVNRVTLADGILPALGGAALGPLDRVGEEKEAEVGRGKNLRADVAALHDEAAEAVLPRQQRRIVAAAGAWLAAHPEHAGYDMRFDAVLIAPGRLPQHIVSAFEAEF